MGFKVVLEKIDFEADDPVFLTSLVAGIGAATLIEDYVVGVVIAGLGLAVLSFVENETVVKVSYGFLLGFVSTLLIKGLTKAMHLRSVFPNEIGVLQ